MKVVLFIIGWVLFSFLAALITGKFIHVGMGGDENNGHGDDYLEKRRDGNPLL